MRACEEAIHRVRIGRGLLDVLMREVILAALAVCVAPPVWAQSDIKWFTIDGGGAMQTVGGSYTLGGTIGQPDAGQLTGGIYSIGGGFWRGGTGVVGIGDGDGDASELPLSFRLHATFPNPLVRRSAVAFDLPETRFVRVVVYDAAGRLARTLAQGSFPAGRHQRIWDGSDESGRPVAAGIYFVRFDSETDRAWQKVVVLR
jgi:flagellar hook capping protein FlgD